MRPNTVVIPLEINRTNQMSSSIDILHRLHGLQNAELPDVHVVYPLSFDVNSSLCLPCFRMMNIVL